MPELVTVDPRIEITEHPRIVRTEGVCGGRVTTGDSKMRKYDRLANGFRTFLWTLLIMVSGPLAYAQELGGDLGEVKIKLDFKQDQGVNDADIVGVITLDNKEIAFSENVDGRSETEILESIRDVLRTRTDFGDRATVEVVDNELIITPNETVKVRSVVVNTGVVQEIDAGLTSANNADAASVLIIDVKNQQGGFDGVTSIILGGVAVNVVTTNDDPGIDKLRQRLLEVLQLKFGSEHVLLDPATSRITFTRKPLPGSQDDAGTLPFKDIFFATTVPALDPELTLTAIPVTREMPALNLWGLTVLGILFGVAMVLSLRRLTAPA